LKLRKGALGTQLETRLLSKRCFPNGDATTDNQEQSNMQAFIKNFANDESGATAIEYGLIAALVAVAMISAASTVGKNITNTFTNVSNNIK
jgi:pilus assembly protein Flp/PilA